jgi:hypothetical protein
MYHHVKKLMFTVRVDEPDVRFGNMLLEQFGGANGELAADAAGSRLKPCATSAAISAPKPPVRAASCAKKVAGRWGIDPRVFFAAFETAA